MPWHARLDLQYSAREGRTVAHHLHTGPLRILQSLYPEGPQVCHNVLVHPPGGLVGGDTLELDVTAAAGSHGVITTPGATRFYRSEGELALQSTHLRLEADSRLEWLPQEALYYSGCRAENRLNMDLAPGAELLGWDVTALGLPNADQPFVQGSLHQHIEVPGAWLERATIAAEDKRLLDSPVGMDGHRCMATLFLVSGSAADRARRERALDSARASIATHSLTATAGATSPHPRVIVVRVLSPVVEPAMELLRSIREVWRSEMWSVSASNPRIWSM